MNVYRRYHSASHLGVVLGMLTFCVADASPGLALVAIVMVAGSWVLFRDTALSPLPRWTVNLLLFGATANLFRQALFSPVPLKEVAITLLGEYLVYLQLIKLYETRTPRDQAQLLVLNVMLVVGAVLTSVTLNVGLMIAAYTPVFLYAVLLFQLYAGQHRSLAPQSRPAPGIVSLASAAGRRAGRHLRGLTLVAMILISGGATLVFLVMPRHLGDEFATRMPEPVAGAGSGFADSVQLGLSGLISESRDIVLEFDLYIDGRRASTPVNQYLRGTVLDRYDPVGRRWHRSRALREGDNLHANRLLSRRRGFEQLPAPRFSNTGVEQVYRVINKRTDHLFALWCPDQVASTERARIFLNPDDGTLRMPNRIGLLTYSVRSYPSYPNLKRIRGADEDEQRWRRFAQRADRDDDGDDDDEDDGRQHRTGERGAPSDEPEPPANDEPAHGDIFDGAAVQRYAQDLMSEAGIERRDDASNDAQILALFERHLRASFTYTLDLVPPPEDVDPLENFLYTTRSGHCEYFASAMAAMAQSVGIEARIVTGFVTNEVDPATGSYIVRKSHAHAWVEGRVLVVDNSGEPASDVVAYTPAWERFDPTPPSELSAQSRRPGGVIAWVQRAFERAEQMWVRGVVAYSAEQQRSALGATGLSSFKIERLPDVLSSLRHASIGALLRIFTVAAVSMVVFLAVLWGVTLSARWIWRRATRLLRRWWLARTNPPEARRLRQLELYERMLALLERAGLAKPATLPPLAYAHALTRTRPDVAPGVERLARLYYAVRYAHAPLTPALLDEAERTLEELQAALAAGAPA